LAICNGCLAARFPNRLNQLERDYRTEMRLVFHHFPLVNVPMQTCCSVMRMFDLQA
jgi:hypothetical protein